MKNVLNGKGIILLASSNYETINNSKLNVHIIAEEFAKLGVRVLFVESLGLKDFPIYEKYGLQKIIIRLLKFIKMLWKGPEVVNENIYILSLIRLPFDNLNIINSLNRRLVTYFIAKYSKRYLKNKPILWTFLPTYWYLPRKIENSAVIYHNVDDYSAVPNVNKSYIVSSERKLLRESDLVFTVSKSRVAYFKEYTKSDVVFLNNVANYSLFSKARENQIKQPLELTKILELNKPIVGFVGNLASYKENVKLLTEIAKKGEQYSFVIIGGIVRVKFLPMYYN